MKKFSFPSQLIVLISILLLAGCSKEEVKVESKCFLTTESDDERINTFTYASDKLSAFNTTYPASPADNKSYTVTFDSKGNLAKDDDGKSYTLYTYNDKNQLTRRVTFNSIDNKQKRGTSYEYNSSGQLVKSIDFELTAATSYSYDTYEYTSVSAKNSIRGKHFITANDNLITITEYEYDDKKRFAKDLGFSASLFAPPAENNVTKRIEKDASGKVNYTTVYTYEYNENGYPTQMVKVGTTPGSTSSTTTTTYTYNCK
jgi:hypothetical protein